MKIYVTISTNPEGKQILRIINGGDHSLVSVVMVADQIEVDDQRVQVLPKIPKVVLTGFVSQ